jgi:hypothetical protein
MSDPSALFGLLSAELPRRVVLHGIAVPGRRHAQPGGPLRRTGPGGQRGSDVRDRRAVWVPTAAGDLRVFRAAGLPLVSTLNWSPSQTRANNAVVALGAAADLTAHPDQASRTVHLIIDVNGYSQ